MKHPGLILAAALGLAINSGGLAAAQLPGDPRNPGTASLQPPADAPPIKANPPGPYAVTIEANPSLMSHTIYRPENLDGFTGAKRLPIIAWGNGACSNAGLLFQNFLTNVSSYGFVIIASGPKDAPLPSFARGQAPATPPASPPVRPAMTTDADMKTAIDWAIAENERQGSPYFHRLDPGKVAVMGQSCGGLQAIVNSADPRVKTSIVWNSGVFPEGTVRGGTMTATKASLAGIHAPVAYINGGPADAAHINAVDDIARIKGVPVFSGWINVGHGGTFSHPGGGRFAAVGVAWLNWRLNGDRQAARMFEGPGCELCKDPVWHVTKKDMR